MATTIDIKPLLKLSASVKKQCSTTGGGPLRRSLQQCAQVYRSFLQRRYVKQSRGGGEWPPLAPSTIKKRRKGSGSAGRSGEKGKGKRVGFDVGSIAILRDTGILFAALDSGTAPGAVEKDIPGGIRVGYGGTSRHPGGDATIADIAGFHQEGGGRLPRRRIMVEPDANTMRKFGVIVSRGMANEIRSAGKAR